MSLLVSVSNEILNIGENLTRLLNGLVDQYGDTNIKDNEYVNILLKTIDDIPEDGFGWSWSEEISHTLPVTGSITLTLGASAAAEATILPQPSYVFTGNAGIWGSIRVPFSYADLDVSGAARGSAALRATFNHPPTTRVLTALASDLPIVANLLNPQQLLNETFTSASLKLQSAVNLGAQLTAGRSWLAARGGSGSSSATAEATAGLQYGIDSARTGEFDVEIQANEHLLTMSLTEVHTEVQRRSLSINTSVQSSGIREMLQPVLDRIAGLPAPLEDIVQKYSRPGDIFKELLSEKLSTTDIHIQAEVSTGNESATSFVDQLVEEALSTVYGNAERWTAFAQAEVTSLTASILGRINIPQTAKAALEAVLHEKLLEMSDSLAGKLQSQIESALKKKAGGPIVDFLNSVSDRTTTGLNVANTTATELLKPVEALLAKYNS